ncbi:peptide methionine sulfoxide reductase [Tamlana crocina]|uniref:Peptide methionine sulfoxide reductase n=1 Tax=Tamlana crocina TaxID=393006 RepID=A0ABX1DDV0_9FLAO|nr:peptide methionine sulfoxide reductase [Tamlana crocina]NJX15254.1 peptide methionine sulfoxide reductase [Tamlana crocina]
MGVLDKIKGLPVGYSVVEYQNKKYGVTRTDFNNGKSFKVFAKALGGSDFISLNYYITERSEFLKPCEMPNEKVIHFLNHYKRLENG